MFRFSKNYYGGTKMNTKRYNSIRKPVLLIGLIMVASMILAACSASAQANPGSSS